MSERDRMGKSCLGERVLRDGWRKVRNGCVKIGGELFTTNVPHDHLRLSKCPRVFVSCIDAWGCEYSASPNGPCTGSIATLKVKK